MNVTTYLMKSQSGERCSVSSAAEGSLDVARRAEDFCCNQGGSRTEHYEHSGGNATTGACDSEGTENGECPSGSVH